MKKRLFHIICFTVFVTIGIFFVAGQSIDFLLFKYRESAIKKEMKTKIKKGVADKELILFTSEQLKKVNWSKPGKEFKFGEHFYDVVKFEFRNGHFQAKCVSDTQETKLFSELSQLIQKRMSEDPVNNDYYKNLLKDYLKIYFGKEKLFVSYIELNSSHFYLCHSLQDYSDIPFSPPKNGL